MKNAVLDNNGLLYITGPGECEKYLSPDEVPWKECRDSITTVAFADGVKIRSIMNWFWGCENLKEVRNWPDGLEDMAAAFCGCRSLMTVPRLPGSLRDMDEAFIDCASLESMPLIPDKVIYACDAFVRCRRLSGRMTLRGQLTQFAFMFQEAAGDGDGLTVDYTFPVSRVIDDIIATADGGNVFKGDMIKVI